jgi:deoxyribodipyrimidine photo-lyase
MPKSSGAAPTIFWFRQDLRLSDSPALAAALRLATDGSLIPVYIWAPSEEKPFSPGAASRVWLHESLTALDGALQAKGSRLVIRTGPTARALADLIAETGARAVFWSRRTEPAMVERDARIAETLHRQGVATPPADLPPAALLFEPEAIRTEDGRPFQVFTPFWRAALKQPTPAEPLRAPATIPPPRAWPASQPLASLDLRPSLAWDAGIRAAWTPGEAGARARLRHFLDQVLADYGAGRDRPDRDGTSRLSPHLHFGELSPRQIWHAVHNAGARRSLDPGPFLRELGWREFAHHVLHHFPHTATEPMRPAFANFPWAKDLGSLRAWQRGQTGYPLVDAGLRELWVTGFLHNRVRMVVASFLTKHLLLPWQEGARWFWDTLVDADLANNTMGWQWTAGSGVDAAPYFRIFNPVIQGTKFDPEGAYVKRWLPALARLPRRYLHAPWTAPPEILTAAGVRLGRDYPLPIVDHAWARARALAALPTR